MYLSVVDVGTTVIPYYRDTFTNRYKMYRRRELNAAAVRLSSLNQSLDATTEDVEDLPTYANTQELPEYRVAVERSIPMVTRFTVEAVSMPLSEANNNNSLRTAPTQNPSGTLQPSSLNQSLDTTAEDVEDPPTYANAQELPEYRVALERPVPEVTRFTVEAVNMPVSEIVEVTEANNNNVVPKSFCSAPTQNPSGSLPLSSQNQSLDTTTAEVQDPPTNTNTRKMPECRVALQRPVTEVTWALPQYRLAVQVPNPEINRVTEAALNTPERRVATQRQRPVTEVTWALPEYRVSVQRRPVPKIPRAVNMPVLGDIDATKLTEAEQKIHDVAKDIWSRAKTPRVADEAMNMPASAAVEVPATSTFRFLESKVTEASNVTEANEQQRAKPEEDHSLLDEMMMLSVPLRAPLNFVDVAVPTGDDGLAEYRRRHLGYHDFGIRAPDRRWRGL